MAITEVTTFGKNYALISGNEILRGAWAGNASPGRESSLHEIVVCHYLSFVHIVFLIILRCYHVSYIAGFVVVSACPSLFISHLPYACLAVLRKPQG
eukprot:CAMPEP_0204617238 /NCGR_PEP_ID=MMETSP0717-20131115/4273_1 /ASSEMBLY_ACC=CAM_ASM_000666 /TAXON_ID=230516 /ORGANISM="Chaetoceros curvisetus" /LENGTH=96 /DNA_ID=CAMNT_0051630717 /DNA_START=196 /DNA_END=486 /DNA_ORIENTATION=+